MIKKTQQNPATVSGANITVTKSSSLEDVIPMWRMQSLFGNFKNREVNVKMLQIYFTILRVLGILIT